MKMDVDTLYSNEDVKKRGTHHFRTQDDLNKFFREKKELAAKNAIEKHEKYLNELRETKTAKIFIPYEKGIENSTTFGALTGDIIGSGAGAVIGGALGAGDMLDVLGGAVTGSLILGGAGAVIGGLINAADDGITWAESILVIKQEILTISGKFSLKDDFAYMTKEKLLFHENQYSYSKYYNSVEYINRGESPIIYVFPNSSEEDLIQRNFIIGSDNVLQIPVKGKNHGVCFFPFTLSKFMSLSFEEIQRLFSGKKRISKTKMAIDLFGLRAIVKILNYYTKLIHRKVKSRK